MIEQGFCQLVLSGISGQFSPDPQMFAVQLPQNWITSTNPKGITYRTIASDPGSYVLEGQDPLTVWHVQVDCWGETMTHAILLARSVDSVLRGGFAGTLTDPDNTIVQMIKRLPGMTDGFSSEARNYCRSLEYEVTYLDS
jgi:hypothetical protein